MSPNPKNDLLYLLNILESTEKILFYVRECRNAKEFYDLNDQLNYNASLTLLSNIGENISKLTEILKLKYSNISWQNIKNFRNKIVHDYGGIDRWVVFDIIERELPLLSQDVIQIILKEIKSGIFDLAEFQSVQNSPYYKHIPFERMG